MNKFALKAEKVNCEARETTLGCENFDSGILKTVQLGLYISPVAFSTTLVPEKFQLLYYLNPMVAVIDGFRWAISGGQTAFNITEVFVSITVVTLLCIFGAIYFRKTEKTFADVI